MVQTMYSYMLTRPECTLDKALKDLDACLSKTYELYHYLMRLPVELTHVQEMRLDEARNKYLLGLILYIGKEAMVLDAGVVERSLESL